MNMYRDFPEDFVWGSATASYQVEGAPFEDGKGASVWNEFEKRPGAMRDDVNGDVACDHYHRYPEDIAHMKNIGLNGYRFSLAWSRIFPDGYGKVNQKGIDHYKRVCETLLKNGVEPYVTLYHWDLPLALQKEFGGWESRETVKYFGEYASKIGEEFKGLIKYYCTTNEFLAASDVAYSMGLIAPGLKLEKKRVNQIRHHLLLAHGTAVSALRAADADAKISLAENSSFMVPLIDTPEYVAAAKKAFREVNAHFLTAVMEGKYLDCYLEKEGADAPVFTDDDMKIIGQKLDWLGLNIYFGKRLRPAPETKEGYHIFEETDLKRQTGIADFYFEPAAMYWGSRIAYELYGLPIYITENGKRSETDKLEEDGHVYDDERIRHLRLQLLYMAKAVREGIPVKGYFHWSLMDNLEWHHGFRPRFGYLYVNYATLERTPKLSAEWMKEVIRTGRIA
ncbi:MAG: family 1 glycosylhydrolase [Lentisphaeria bacterium]|nr:family 1 glycosylhydrolase [Lentisphaeria bacterium]